MKGRKINYFNVALAAGRLNWGGEAEAEFRKYSVGNGVCNYRHVFAIYYEVGI